MSILPLFPPLEISFIVRARLLGQSIEQLIYPRLLFYTYCRKKEREAEASLYSVQTIIYAPGDP